MEYLILLFEFVKTRGWNGIILSVVAPLIICCAIQCNPTADFSENVYDFHSTIQTIIGVLMGFTISTITILLSVDSEGIKEAKKKFMMSKLYGKRISLFKYLIVGLSYLVVIQGALLLVGLVLPLFWSLNSNNGKVFFLLEVFFSIHVIMVFMRSILDFYFTITPKNQQ